MSAIQQTSSAMGLKPLAATDKRFSSAIAEKKEKNTDKVSLNAPELIGTNEQATVLNGAACSSASADPVTAAATHTADYRLMEVLRG